jgi:hypothetical protein
MAIGRDHSDTAKDSVVWMIAGQVQINHGHTHSLPPPPLMLRRISRLHPPKVVFPVQQHLGMRRLTMLLSAVFEFGGAIDSFVQRDKDGHGE